MQIGRRIYYDKYSGEVLVNTGERSGAVIEKTVDQDISDWVKLAERNRDSFDVIELEYGSYSQDFIESQGNCRVNTETKTLEFSYPDSNEQEVEQPYQIPLSDQIATSTDYLLDVDFRLIMIELGMY